jgi:hypothetical protein
MPHRHLRKIAGLAASLCAGLPAAAQDVQPKHLTLLGIPSATVAPGGLGFASLSYSTDRLGGGGGAGGPDGSAALGFGLGSAEERLGLQVTAHVTSLSDDFGDSGYLELKAARQIATGAAPTYASLTLGHLGTWGDARVRDVSATVAVTTFTNVRLGAGRESFPLMLTLGAGSHIRNNSTDPGVFFGAGVGLTRNLAASVAWSGEYVNLGASYRFEGSENLGLTATLYDAFDQKNSRRAGISITYVFNDIFGGVAR